jgi:hypothetical protein
VRRGDCVATTAPSPSSHAREASACFGAKDPPHSGPMAGSPLKRARKQGIRLEDGSIVAFPYMPRVADLPPGWRHFSTAQKIEHLIGLDRCYELLSWPWAGLDPLRRSMQIQVIRVLLPIGIKALLDGSLGREAARERDRAAIKGAASNPPA